MTATIQHPLERMTISSKSRSRSLFLLFILSLSSISLTISARISPLIKEPSRPIFRVSPFDTSNYGKLQLNNGLALTPQMGSALFQPFNFFSFFFFSLFFWFYQYFFCIWICCKFKCSHQNTNFFVRLS